MIFASFLFFSFLEYIAFIYFMLVLFRFDIKENLLKFAVFSVVLSFVSNTLQTESLRAISPVVQAGLMILFVAFFLRVHFFNSSIMVITGYVINFIVQWTISGLTLHFSGLEEIDPYTANAYIMQASSAFIMFILGVFTHRQNGGFSFISQSSRLVRSKIFVKSNRLFILFLSLSVVVIFFATILFVFSKNPPYLLVSIILILSLIALIFISIKRDGTNHG
ncbi:hypothetical protein [Cohnella cellulosilytica]|uniref:Uncharacterized protein n=1 Tax=Cohnella cellulosilytica TaxID=986710 RepID=A0ABW2F9G5_9BACL